MQPDTQVSQRTNELGNLPPLVIMVTDVNRHEHLTDIVSHHLHDAFIVVLKKRQKRIVEHDLEQQSIREFFGGGGAEMPVKALLKDTQRAMRWMK